MNDDTQYLTLKVGEATFAIEVDAVREVLDLAPVTPVPYAPPYLCGMLDVRGRSVPVIDLRVKFGLPAAEADSHTRIVVLELNRPQGPLVIGARTDRVFEVTALDQGDGEAPPDIGERWRSDFIGGIGRRNGAMVIVLDLAGVFSGEECRTLAATAA